MTSDFKQFGFSETMVSALSDMGITTPTPIQEKAIPPAMLGRDILATAQTGTGKTMAFALPVISGLVANPDTTALILAPTRELAMQVKDMVRKLFGEDGPFRLALLIGGEAISKQYAQLRSNPRLIIGTPGRVWDFIERGNLKMNKTQFLVIDEADRMLDMGFDIQLERIIKLLPTKRQTLMFSATLPPNIMKLADRYLVKPESIAIGSSSKPASQIKQEMVELPYAQKFPRLLKELEERDGSIIVFVRTKRGAAQLAERLQDREMSADAIHGDLRQRERDRVMSAFRRGKNRIMVATDIAARGLDIPQIKHVINYELPQCPEDYIHRIGRTARAGAEGSALCFVSPDERRQWDMIDRVINPEEYRKRVQRPNGPSDTPKNGRPFSGRSFGGGGRSAPRRQGGGGFGGGGKAQGNRSHSRA